MQQNSFDIPVWQFRNPDNLALEESAARTNCLAFYQKNGLFSETDMFKKDPNSVCTSTVAVSPDPLTLAPQFQWLRRLQTT